MLRASVLLLGFVGASCSASPLAHENLYTTRVESPGGDLVDVSLVGVTGKPSWFGYVSVIDTRLSVKGKISRVVYGHSGAPVYVDGRLVGGLCRGLDFYSNNVAFGARPIADIRWWSSYAVENFLPESGAKFTAKCTDVPAVRAGEVLRCATVWGDVENGSVGTVTEVDNGIISMFAHATRGPHGPVNGVALGAQVLSFQGQMLGQVSVRTRTEDPVGAVFFQSPFGLVVVEGQLPPHFRVNVYCTGLEPPVRKVYNVVINHNLDSELLQVVSDVEAALGGARGCRVETTAYPPGGDPSDKDIVEHDGPAAALGWIFDRAEPGSEWIIEIDS